MWLMLLFLWAIFEKPGSAAGAMWIIIIVISYIHIQKYNSRGFPLSPEDFQLASEASSLTKFVSMASIVRMVIAILLVVGLTILFNRMLAKKLHLNYHNPSPSFYKRHYLLTRLIILVISGLSFYAATDFVRHNDGSRYEDIFLGTHFTAWNQNRNYSDNGFILGFLYNLQKLELTEPDKYSEDKINSLRDEYTERAETENQTRIAANEEGVSFVIILNESFFDPAVTFGEASFEEYYPHTGGDITPNLHRIMQNTPSGYMYTLDYGGGTANIEFETFTSLTNYWANTVPYTALLPKSGDIPSVARTYKELGYETVAIHPYNGGMYKRNIALANQGFDTFITELEMDFKEKEGNSEYINDESAYKQTLKVLEESDKNQIVGLITMQNHTPYHSWIYDETDFAVTNDNITDDRKNEIATYYQYLHNSDKYLGDFIEGIDKLDKKVVVLFYGDHSAGLFDITNNNDDKTARTLSRVMPYFVYANYDANFSTKHLPTTTPNCMVNTTFNILNWKKDPLYYLVDDVCTADPILTASFIENGTLHELETMHDYELLTYDILGGKKYWMNK
jgi:phosphoglycerol transferase MdoB-like AlkP superfamily enzyme